MTTMTTATGPFDRQSDDILAHVLSFLDYESAVIFSKETFEPLTTRFHSDSFTHVWRKIYARHGFSPMESASQSPHYMQECKERRELVMNLVGTPKTKTPRHCFNLPNRFFYFSPVLPTDNDDFLDMDPPPTDFHCDSFVLTCPGTSGELLFLDPFDMSLSIQQNCTDDAVASDEAMMTKAMLNAASAVDVRREHYPHQNEREEHIVGAAIEDTVYRNHNVQEYRTPPSQVLISAEDYFDVNLAEYFVYTEDRHARRRTRQGHLLLHPEDEVDFGYIGVEAKPIVGKNGQLEGTMIGLGRFLSSFGAGGAAPEESISCTEIVTWRKFKGKTEYGNVRICRVPYDIFCADTCSRNNRMYVVFYRGQGPHLSRVPEDDDLAMDDTDSSSPVGCKTVVAYPLMPTDIETQDAVSSPRYFPKPEFSIACSDFVSYVTVDCTGTLLVGTNNGTIEVWKPTGASVMSRVALIKSKEAVDASAKRFKTEMDALSCQAEDIAMEDQDAVTLIPQINEFTAVGATKTTCTSLQMDTEVLLVTTQANCNDDQQLRQEFDSMVDDDARIAVLDDDLNDALEDILEDEPNEDTNEPAAPVAIENDEQVPRILGSPAIVSFHFSSHLPIEDRGFVSMQYNRTEGTSLLLWKTITDSDFQVVSHLNLPLSPRRKPRIHYDGRRIIVLGEDHIGVIIMVYHVYSSTEDIGYFPSSTDAKMGDDSGGLYNYTLQPHVRFANRIRHAALGGLERYEDMYMTCNERFIIVNTKTGNLGGGASPTGDGLLIIDLQEH